MWTEETYTRKKENKILIKYINTFKKKTIILKRKNNYQYKKRKYQKSWNMLKNKK